MQSDSHPSTSMASAVNFFDTKCSMISVLAPVWCGAHAAKCCSMHCMEIVHVRGVCVYLWTISIILNSWTHPIFLSHDDISLWVIFLQFSGPRQAKVLLEICKYNSSSRSIDTSTAHKKIYYWIMKNNVSHVSTYGGDFVSSGGTPFPI